MWSFVKRHRNKFVAFGVVSAASAGGLYLLNKYVENKVAEQRAKETQQMLEQMKHQHHFESTKRIAEKTLSQALNPALKEKIDEILNTESVFQQLSKDSANLELWQQFKVLTFGKSVCWVICGTLVNFLLKIQLSILNGYIYQSLGPKQNNNKLNLTPKIQEKFLSFCKLFIERQIGQWTLDHLLPTITAHLDYLELNKKITMAQIQDLYSKMQRSLVFDTKKIGEFLVNVNGFDWKVLDEAESATLKVLIADTLDILETPDFSIALTNSVNTGFNFLQDQIVENCQTKDLLDQILLINMLPKIDKVLKNDTLLLEKIQNTDQSNSLMANVFETFCIPINLK